MNVPNYSKCLLSLVTSVLAHYGVETKRESYALFDELLSKNPKNVVVMLFDGLGENILEKHLFADDFLLKNRKDVISSVFPPTTTAATTTMVSGLSPAEHGWLGWTLRFDEIKKNVCVFPNTEFLKDTPAEDFSVGQKYIPYESVFEKIKKATSGKVAAEYVSAFSEYKTETLESVCETVKALCSQEGEKYVYAYYKQPDHDIHDYGVNDERVGAVVKKINDAVETLSRNLRDTLLVVIADHGLIDVEWKFLPEYPVLWDCLDGLPSIEPRALSLFVKKNKKRIFEKEFRRIFSGEYELFTKREVFDKRIFGFGTPHAKTKDFVGDYLAVAIGKTALNVIPPTDDVFKAMHAGSTTDEYSIPFIAVEL